MNEDFFLVFHIRLETLTGVTRFRKTDGFCLISIRANLTSDDFEIEHVWNQSKRMAVTVFVPYKTDSHIEEKVDGR